MAKQAKTVEVEVTERTVKGIVKDVLSGFDDLESARGSYMNKARRIRETITAIYERGAARGIPQKVMKLQIKIVQQKAKLVSLITELEGEERKMLQKVAKAYGDHAQLALFKELPPIPKAEKPPKAAKEPKQSGISGEQLNAAMEAAGTA